MLKTTFSCLKHPSHAQTVVLLFSFWNRVKDFDASFFFYLSRIKLARGLPVIRLKIVSLIYSFSQR